MEYLNILKLFNEKYKKPLNKNYCLETAIIDMFELKEMLNMNNLFYASNTITKEGEQIKEITLNTMWLYLKNYTHLSDDKELLKQIKKEANKIIVKYNTYFYALKKNDKIKYDVIKYI
jgi:hypothetical protein